MATFTTISGTEMLRQTNYKAEHYSNPIKEDVNLVRCEAHGSVLYYKMDEVPDLAKPYVCVVLKIADFTGGRGPMRLLSVYQNMDDAVAFVMSQPGVYGTEQHATTYPGVNIYGKPYVVSGFNGYDIMLKELK